MAIEFSTARWTKIKNDARQWWAGTLPRPLIQAYVKGKPPGRVPPRQPAKSYTAQYPFSVSAEEIVDVWDYELASVEFLGDAFPSVVPNFGPGIMAAFMGADVQTTRHTVWFKPQTICELSDVQFDYDAQNPWLERVRACYWAALDRWQGQVLLGMTDLGGNLDVLSTFRPGEQLLLDLYDHPEDVKRQTWKVHAMWWRYFEEFNALLQPVNPGYSAWCRYYSDMPFYILQCDFCYMISPAMFDEFVLPELTASCRKLGNAFYHLDGPGQLPHLDSLLSIPELKGIQWVPGRGQPDVTHWLDIFRRIRAAGKLLQLGLDGLWALDAIAEALGSAAGIITVDTIPMERKAEAVEILRRHGADVQ